MSGFLPPVALRERLGNLDAIASENLVDEQTTLMRDSPREYLALADAIADTPAPCTGDARFTTDRPASLPGSDTAAMRALCLRCHAAAECDAFATAAQPPTGFWSGQQYPLPKDTTPA